MPYSTPSLDGAPIFGLVTASTATAIPPARQNTAFFGVDGRLSQYGGARGYSFTIEGVFQESTIGAIQNDIAAVFAFQGPSTHTYIDTKGNTFYNVIFDGHFTPDPKGPKVTDVGWCQAYSMQMESLL